MESLNLNTLASSLPTGQQNAEKELLNDFKAAALSITKLYRSSRKTSKKAYNAGYGAACQDLLTFIQQGVSAGDLGASPGPSKEVEQGGMTIGRVMDWIEARLEAIKTMEEDEDEDEEREKDKERPRPATVATTRAPAVVPATPTSVVKKQPSTRSKDMAPPNTTPATRHSAEHPSSSPSPPPSSSATTSALPPKQLKSRTIPAHVNSTPSITPFPTSTVASDTPIVIGAGTKRRHAMMMMLDASSPALSLTPGVNGGSSSVVAPGGVSAAGAVGHGAISTGRRRTRSSRSIVPQSQNQNIGVVQLSSEAMDVEEDGRERKRVARR